MSNEADQKGWLKDGAGEFSAGLDKSKSPSDIPRDALAEMTNATVRGGNIAPRPGWLNHGLTFDSPQTQAGFLSGYFQTGEYYDGGTTGIPALLSSHSGRQFRIDLITFSVSEITPIASFTTTTTQNFTIPVAPGTVAVNVASTANMDIRQTGFTINGIGSFALISINSATQITVQYNGGASGTISSGSTVTFTGYDVNDPTTPLNWSTQAEQWWILEDNEDQPVIFDGASAIRSSAALNQVPTGNVIGYVNGRLLVALRDRKSYTVGDLVYDSSGTPLYSFADAILYFTETKFLTGGSLTTKIFPAPGGAGQIRSIKAQDMTNTSLGQGPAIVGCPNGVFTVNLPFDALAWQNTTNPLQTASVIRGPLSPAAIINGDLWYRSIDGYRSYVTSQRQNYTQWANTSQSNELDNYTEEDNQSLLEWCSLIWFNNRLISTMSPEMSPSGVFHRGFVVLDFDLSTSLRQKSPIAWEGIWTKPNVRPLRIVSGPVNGVERCFFWSVNNESQIEVWEISENDTFDDGAAQNPITGRIEFGSWNFGNSDQFKHLLTGRLILEQLRGNWSYTVTYRTDASSCWNDWTSGCICAKNKDCGPFNCSGPVQYKPQVRWPLRLPEPPDDNDSVNGIPNNKGFEFQMAIDFTGYAEIKQARLIAKDEPEQVGITEQPPNECPSQPGFTYYNVAQTATVSCPGGETGNSVSESVPAGQYGSNSSQQDADNQAYQAALTKAQSLLQCVAPGQLNQLSWQIPGGPSVSDPADQTTTFTGEPNYTYTAVVRIRGVAETCAYLNPAHGTPSNGTAYNNLFAFAAPLPTVPAINSGTDLWGHTTPNFNPDNEYFLAISNPPQLYALNNSPTNTGASGRSIIDYNLSFQIVNGATVTLQARTVDGQQWTTPAPLSCNNVPPTVFSQPVNGQALEMDVISIT